MNLSMVPGLKKGSSPQQVESVFPEAISYQPDFIPSVYTWAEKTNLDGGSITITTSKNHDFATGDKVRLIT